MLRSMYVLNEHQFGLLSYQFETIRHGKLHRFTYIYVNGVAFHWLAVWQSVSWLESSRDIRQTFRILLGMIQYIYCKCQLEWPILIRIVIERMFPFVVHHISSDKLELESSASQVGVTWNRQIICWCWMTSGWYPSNYRYIVVVTSYDLIHYDSGWMLDCST